ncbi:hypothetical protein H5410_035904 [Solanum commersonii]|uniref:Uncharacterized protein n=1 Tax=Solanum commersonii TaxID=4109 RepID=A0A9J5Y4Z8_SOLCO|nr:hypothetical protein H5410_035904 [Solanum commersonii]
MSNAMLNQICNDENDPMLGVKIRCKHRDLFQCKLHGPRTFQVEDFGLVHAINNACKFFRWRNSEDIDLRSKFVILRLAKRIKKLEIDDESHIKRSNKWMMKEKKKTKCCNNWKLIFAYDACGATYESNVSTYEAYVAIDDPCGAIYESNVATYVAIDDPFVATYESNIAIFEVYVATDD